MKNAGSLIDSLKSGENFSFRHQNPYIQEALSYSNLLFTKKELLDKNHFLQSDCPNNLIIEIGCYLGKTVIELATLNPNAQILGLDITYKRAVKSTRKIFNQSIKNATIALCDGLFLCQKILPSNSVSGICVFFPDPWPKERQEKNRLLNKEFVEALFKVLKPGGFFWLKTDQKDYFLNAEFLLKESGFILTTQTIPNILNAGSYETEFQKLFTQKQVPFYQGVFQKI